MSWNGSRADGPMGKSGWGNAGYRGGVYGGENSNHRGNRLHWQRVHALALGSGLSRLNQFDENRERVRMTLAAAGN